MSSMLTKATVLVLNRNWQAINVRTPQEAFCMMATNVATGLEIEAEDHIRPLTWVEWITLPIRDQDEAVHTIRGQIRVPTRPMAVNECRGGRSRHPRWPQPRAIKAQVAGPGGDSRKGPALIDG
jgi:hypothetical protein